MAQSQFPKLRNGEQPQQSRVQDNISQTVGPVVAAVNKTPMGGAAPPPWVSLALAGGFANVTGNAVAASHLDALKYVHLKFGVANAAGCAANTAMLTLPAGQMPLETIRFAVRGTGATAQFITITNAGVVSVDVAVAAAGTVDGYVSFLGEH